MQENIQASVTQDAKQLQFYLQGFQGECEIRYARATERENWKSLYMGKPADIRLRDPWPDERLLFRVTDTAGNTVHCATRHLPQTGITNFRDIGGFRTRDGSSVKWGLLYRCAALDNAKKQNTAYLASLGLKTIFDLRSPGEVEKRPDILPDGCGYQNVSGIPSLDLDEDTDKTNKRSENLDMMAKLKENADNPEALEKMRDYLCDGYAEMAQKPQAFQTLFQTLLEKPGQPLAFHCAAGKDRTGIAAALILRVLGVDDQTVQADYLASNEYRKKETQKILMLLRILLRDATLLALVRDSMLSVQPAYYARFFTEVEAAYGSFSAFMHEGLLLREADVERLKQIYLE